MKPVKPIRTPAPYIGGKRNLSERLCALIEAVPHTTYAEPFVGMGGIFFKRSWQPKQEVINDYSRDVAILFMILQRLYPQFMSYMQFGLTTRAQFERLARTKPETLLDIERAARFLFLQRTAFGGKVTGQSFGVSVGHPARFDVTKLASILEDVHTRLASVIIECLSYGDFIGRYDSKDTLFYLDPPYWDCEDDYGTGKFSKADFKKLAAALAKIDGRFIMSINDAPEVRAIFKRFVIREITTAYSIAKQSTRPAAELVITNFDEVPDEP